jgi:hypothetical protein
VDACTCVHYAIYLLLYPSTLRLILTPTVLAVLDAQNFLKVLRRSLPRCSKFQLNGVFSFANTA